MLGDQTGHECNRCVMIRKEWDVYAAHLWSSLGFSVSHGYCGSILGIK